MREEDIKNYSEFLKEFQAETDRGTALVGAALIDNRLEKLLFSHFLDCKESSALLIGANAPLGSFGARIKVTYCLGLITKLEYQECEIIRKVRNEFAHKLHGLSFENQKIKDLCSNLRADIPMIDGFVYTSRLLFIYSVIGVTLALWYRPEYNEKSKAKSKIWNYQLSPRKDHLLK